jgi:hypothetical protein
VSAGGRYKDFEATVTSGFEVLTDPGGDHIKILVDPT